MKTPNKSVGEMKFGPALVGLHIGSAALLGGLLLSFMLLILNTLAGQEASADITQNLSSEGAVQVMLSVDPPCGVLGGISIDHMEDVSAWHVGMGSGVTTPTLTSVPGFNNQAIQLDYNLGVIQGNYVQLVRDLSPTLNLSATGHLRFFYRGTKTNTLQVGLTSVGQNYFSIDMNKVTHVPTWTYVTWDFQGIRKGGQPFTDTNPVQAIFISVKKSATDDVGGLGSFTVDELQYLNIASRTIPSSFEWVTAAPTVTQQAAIWIAARQQSNGLLESWQEETADNAWLYDQALGLIVLSDTDLSRAQKLFTVLHDLQNGNGSWDSGFHYNSNPITSIQPITQPVGANAWIVYALSYYYLKSGTPTAHQDALEGANWLANLQQPNGSLPALPSETTAPTEPNLDAWWAFQATGYYTQAMRVQNYLLTQAWDNQIGRFKASTDSYEILLDNQTWGAAFLQAIGREYDARRALSYARWTLATYSYDGSICGFDGAGPFSVWNEGTLQYIAAHGENSQFYWGQIASQQALDGGLPGSPDNFNGYSVWLTSMHGVAPTSWLYFAGTGGPFHVIRRIFLPIITK